jgi:hypothetical protein
MMWEDHTKMDIRETGYEDVYLDSSHLGESPVSGSYSQDNNVAGSIQKRKFMI